MEFLASEGNPLEGTLKNVTADHGFDFEVRDRAVSSERGGRAGETSLTVDTLQLAVGIESGVIQYVWGYWDMRAWPEKELDPVDVTPGIVTVHTNGEREGLEPGISVPLPGGKEWFTEYDEEMGLVRVARDQRGGDRHVLIATGVILTLAGSELTKVWLQPVFE